MTYEWINEKYGRYFGEVFKTREEFQSQYMTEDYMYIMSEWEENGVTLIDVCFEPMANEIVVIEEKK